MFIAIQHEITDPQLFWHQASTAFANPPAGMRLHTAFVNEQENLCQCMWEAESIDQLREYLETELTDSSVNTYYEVDPDRAIV